MASHDEAVARWLDTLAGAEDSRGRRLRNFTGTNLYGEGNRLYSYGPHFPLAEFYPGSRGRRPLFLLNGDRSTVTTTRHQSCARGGVERSLARFGASAVVIPFSALATAGILRETIRPLHVRPDQMITVEHSAPTLAEVPEYQRTTVINRTADTLADVPPEIAAQGWSDARAWWLAGDKPWKCPATGRYHWREIHELQPAADGLYHWNTNRHRLGDALFTAETLHEVRRARPVSVADVVRAAVRSIEARRYQPDRFLDVVETLDNVDIDAPIVEYEQVRRRRRYVSSFDNNEPTPLYFLATLPGGSRARTVESAIEDLAPAAVHAAYARGRHVERQGDIFALATTMRDEDFQGCPRARYTLHSRRARPRAGEPGYVEPFTAADRAEIVRRARRLWRARWNQLAEPAPKTNSKGARERRRLIAQDRAHLHRLSEQGRAAVFGWKGTYPAERARSGQRATRARLQGMLAGDEQRDAYRSGCYGFRGQETALALWRDCLTEARRQLRPELRPERQERARIRARAILSIHGTAHTATEVVRAPGGRTYIRGAMIHEPSITNERRGRDHVRRPLQPGVWYLALRNTVPRASADTRGRR